MHIWDENCELSVCKVCGLYEGALTTDCSGEKAYQYSDDIYSGKLDYRQGIGWVKALNPTNQSWLYGKIFDYYTQRTDRAPKTKKEIVSKFPAIDNFTYKRLEKEIKRYLKTKLIEEYNQ